MKGIAIFMAKEKNANTLTNKERNDMFHKVLKQSQTFVWETNTHGLYRYVSDNVVDIIGYEASELINKMHFYDLHPQEGRETFKNQAFQRMKERVSFNNYENPMVHKNGDVLWVSTTGVPVIDAGRLVAYQGSDINITERIIMNQQMKAQREQFDLAMIGSNDGIWDWNFNTSELFLSTRWKEHLGYAEDELENSPETLKRLFHPDDYDTLMTMVYQYRTNQIDSFHMESRIKHKNGEYLWFESRGAALRDDYGVAYRMGGSHTDITTRKNTEIDLQQTTEYLEKLITYANVPIIVWDMQFIVTRVNQAIEIITGHKASDLLGQPLTFLFAQQEAKDMMQDVMRISGEKSTANNELWVVHKDGSKKCIIWNTALIYDRDGVTPLSIIAQGYDVTALNEVSDKVLHLQDLLQYIINHGNSAIAVHDKNMHYIYVSQPYLTQYRITDKDIIGKQHYDVFPDLPQKWRDVHQRVLNGEVISGNRDPFVREDGSVDWTRWECRPWYEADQTIGGLIVYTEVINELLETEQKIEEARKMLEIVMDNLPIGIAVHSVFPAVDFSYMNDNFYKIYRTTKEKLLVSNSFWEAVYEDETFRETLKKRVEEDIASGDSARMVWKDIPLERAGEKTTYISAYATPMAEGNLLISTVIDVTEQKTKQDDITYISYHDFVTNIPNRRYFSEHLKQLNNDALPLGIMFMDVNGLKLINDAFGTMAGDEVLRQVAHVLTHAVEKGEIIARMGGDEFAILCPNTNDKQMEGIKNNIQDAIAKNRIQNIAYSLSIGYAIKESAAQPINDILKSAEEEVYRKKVIEDRSTRSRAILGILSTLTEKHHVEKIHSQRVSQYCYDIGCALDLKKEELEELKLAGMLHDIGKISTPDHILGKSSKLDPDEWEIMKNHTVNGYNILRAADEYSNLALYALSHHERFDGQGYPNGLKGEDIPLFSRIICIADAYEAMTAVRPYKTAIPKAKAIKELIKHSNTQFDKTIVDVFIKQVLA